jgi:hypothetical protein
MSSAAAQIPLRPAGRKAWRDIVGSLGMREQVW